MRLNDLTAEVQANTGPPPAMGTAFVVLLDAKEFLEHPLAKLWGNPRTGICHGNVQETIALRCCILQGQPRSDLCDGMGSVIRSESKLTTISRRLMVSVLRPPAEMPDIPGLH
jgi:hypothetical protein